MLCVFVISFSLFAQFPQQEVVTGHCLDTVDSRPVAGALVRTLDDKGKTLDYTTTDAEGFFCIKADNRAAILELSLLGYQTVRMASPFHQALEIFVEPSAEPLQQAIVTANKVRMSGDTVQYNIKALKTREDYVLGDALKRLPGIDVSDNGRIRVDGKEIDQFLVDGKDILDKNYDMAVRKLSVDAIASVEVIRGHQRMKMLQGRVDSDNAAVNILLDESARRKVNMSGSLGGGIETRDRRIPLTGEVNAFYVHDKWSSVNTAAYDSEGALLKDATSLPVAAQVRKYDLPASFVLSPISAPIGNQGLPLNQTMDFRSVNTFAPDQASSFGAAIAYARNNEESNTEQESAYHSLQSEDYTLARKESRTETRDRLLGRFQYVKNGMKTYLRNLLAADLGSGSGFADVSGDVIQNAVMRTGDWNISNDLNINWTTRAGKILGIDSYTQWSGIMEQLSVSGRNLRQSVNCSSIWQEVSLKGLFVEKNNWKWSLTPRAQWQKTSESGNLAGSVQGIFAYPIRGETTVSCFSSGLEWSVAWISSLFRMEAGGLFHYDAVRLPESNIFKCIFPDAYLLCKYEKGRYSMDFRLGVTQSMPDFRQLGEYLVLADYLSFRLGKGIVLFHPQGSARLRLNFREPVSGWDIRSSMNYVQTTNQIQGREFVDAYIINYISEETAPLRTLSSQMTISKGMFAINGKISAEISYTRASSDFIQGSDKVAYTTSIPRLSLSFTATPAGFWTTTLDARCTWSKMNLNQQGSSAVMSLATSVRNTFYPGQNWILKAQVDAYFNKEVRKAYVFPSVSAEWKHKKHFCLKITANNLLNIREYAHKTLSPMLDNTYVCQIRPFSVLLGVSWDY